MVLTTADIKDILLSLNLGQERKLRTALNALVDVLDGIQAHDLPGLTGLSPTRCDEISAIRFAVEKAL